MIDYGIDIHVIHLVSPSADDGTRKLICDGIPTTRIPMRTSDPRSVLAARAKLIPLLHTADIIHTQAISSLEPFIGFHPEQPWVHTEHWSAITTPTTLPRLAQPFLPALLTLEKMPDVVVVACDILARPLRKIRGQRAIATIPCQVPSPSRLIPRPTPGDTLRIVSTGGLIDRKDPLTAIRTLAVLKQQGHPASLVWLGEGPLRPQCEALANDLHVDATFPGTVDAQTVQRYLGEADLFFAPTKGDNFFIAAAESIVNGRPLVAGAHGGHAEYTDPRIGTLVDVQDPEAYARAIIDTVERTKDLSAEDIAATVGDRFSPQAVAADHFNLYNSLL